MKKLLLAALFGLTSVAPAFADPITDYWSFSGIYRDPNGNILGSGLVTGTITFAGAGTNIQPLSVYVTSAPPNTLGAGTNSTTNIVANDVYNQADSFTVAADGTVSSFALNVVTDWSTGTNLTFRSDGQQLYSYSSKYYISNYYGANDLTFTPQTAASAVPEPATWAMMLGGFGLVGAALRSRRGSGALAV